MTVDATVLTDELRRKVLELEVDLRGVIAGDDDLRRRLAVEHDLARGAGRTGAPWEVWRDDRVTQAAVAWVLATVFVRFCEDNELVAEPSISGPRARRRMAEDAQTNYFRTNPHNSDRDYLVAVLTSLAALPGMEGLFDRAHNPLWQLPISPDAASGLLAFWRRRNDNGDVVHDFTDPSWSTRFLGDLYQDLSEHAKAIYALLQTPVFVEEFILDRTLEPAIAEFGLEETTLIDPTCGSGHFLLGAFARLLEHWRLAEPGTNDRELAQRALKATTGVDLNPYAVAIARFRLVIAALHACAIKRLADAPDFKLDLAVGDSLIHGVFPDRLPMLGMGGDDHLWEHAYHTEDREALDRIFSRKYAAVVGNPPYITVKDSAISAAYRLRYESCRGKYSLGVPFTERFVQLANDGHSGTAGFVGMITANSFMKREMGKDLVEKILPTIDLTTVIDTSGAYIPGHGTPTVILFARHRPAMSDKVRMVLGIRGEPGRPDNPAKGLVWSSIEAQVDDPGSESTFVSVADVARAQLRTHPWSIGGGGANELQLTIEGIAHSRLWDLDPVIGFASFPGLDDVFVFDRPPAQLASDPQVLPFTYGEVVRDWDVHAGQVALVTQTADGQPCQLQGQSARYHHLWPYRRELRSVVSFGGQTREQLGHTWWTWYRWIPNRYVASFRVTFAFVATHNHFVLDRGGKVFKQSAPVIKLPETASEDDHLELLGLLNSSTACFWMKQVFYPKGGDQVGQEGARIRKTWWDERYEFDGTKLKQFPLPSGRPLERARRLDSLAQRLSALTSSAVAAAGVPTRAALDEARAGYDATRAEMIANQEELDWECLRLYSVVDEDLTTADPPPLALGERAFEIVLARKVADGEEETAWFERHRSSPLTAVPDHWPDDYRALVERRVELIETDRNVGLIERPECKRRWASEPWAVQEHAALRSWLLDRMEAAHLWLHPDPRLLSTNRLADALLADAEWLSVARVYEGRDDIDLPGLARSLALSEAVPAVAAARYTSTGRDKRALWERTWDAQRAEDAIDALGLSLDEAAARKAAEVGRIDVPPKYKPTDFRSTTSWQLRGKLDVPKERFILIPGAERDADPSPVIGWAGWDHLQTAQAIAAYVIDRRESDGWDGARLAPLLTAWAELMPWVRQWHNAPDAAGLRLGDYFTDTLDGLTRELRLSADDLRAWTPAAPVRGRRKRVTL